MSPFAPVKIEASLLPVSKGFIYKYVRSRQEAQTAMFMYLLFQSATSCTEYFEFGEVKSRDPDASSRDRIAIILNLNDYYSGVDKEKK